MCISIPFIRPITAGVVLACVAAITGCDRNTSSSADITDSQAMMTSAPASSVVSNVAIKGDETLPPNHPPLPSAPPPHPTNSANNPSDLNQQLASLHPRQANKKISVSVPDSVKGKWASATLAVTVENGAEKKLKLAIGETISLTKNLQLHLVHFLPAYTSDLQTVTSSSSKLVNPAVQIQSISDGRVEAEGWVFQKFPDFNSFTDEKIKVRLVSAQRARK